MRHLVILALCVLSWVPLVQAEDDWQAGFARRNITPRQRVYLAGYADRNKPFEEVRDELFVKALALADPAGRKCVLVTSDLLGYRSEFAEQIVDRITSRSKLEPAAVLLNSSHTHSAPLLTLDRAFRAKDMTEDQAAASVAYTEQVIEETVAVALEALAKLEPAQLSYGTGVATFVMNRREPTEQGVRLGFHPSGYVDRSVPVLRIAASDGRLRGVVFGAACHNTTLTGGHYLVSGDYAGEAQRLVERELDGVQAMFVLGLAGSANPHPRGEVEHVAQHGHSLAQEVLRVADQKLTPIRGELSVAQSMVSLPLAAPPSETQIEQWAAGGGWQQYVGKQMKERLARGESLPRDYVCPLTAWQIGERLTLVGISGEVVGEFVPLIQHAIGPRDLWLAGYCHDVFGYVPTRQVLAGGGYETRGVIYAGIGQFAPEVEDVLVAAVRALAEQVGRRQP